MELTFAIFVGGSGTGADDQILSDEEAAGEGQGGGHHAWSVSCQWPTMAHSNRPKLIVHFNVHYKQPITYQTRPQLPFQCT